MCNQSNLNTAAMDRAEMLKYLSSIRFAIFFPDNSWEDVGFTEREIWVNSKGYGYIACDEPTAGWKLSDIFKETLSFIQEKIRSNAVTYRDIEQMSLAELLSDIEYDETEDDLNDILKDIPSLPTKTYRHIYCMATEDGIRFFSSKRDFDRVYERDWADCCWKDMDDDTLRRWVQRLSN